MIGISLVDACEKGEKRQPGIAPTFGAVLFRIDMTDQRDYPVSYKQEFCPPAADNAVAYGENT
jgi:hypothetical protein